MNVLVEMEIPKSCEECPFAYETEGVSHDFCQYIGYESDIEKFIGACSNGRPGWCPFNYAKKAVLSQEIDCGEMTQMQDQDCNYISLAVREGSALLAKEVYDSIRRLRLRQKNNGEVNVISEKEHQQYEALRNEVKSI